LNMEPPPEFEFVGIHFISFFNERKENHRYQQAS